MALLPIFVAAVHTLHPSLALRTTAQAAHAVSAHDPGIPLLGHILHIAGQVRAAEHLPLLDGLTELRHDQLDGRAVGRVAWDGNVHKLRVAVGIDHADAGHADADHLGDRVALLGLINEDADVRISFHVHDTMVLLFKAGELALVLELLELVEDVPSTLLLLFLQRLYELHRFADHREVADQSSNKLEISIENASFCAVLGHNGTSLLLGANQDEGRTFGGCLHDVVARTIQVGGCLDQVKDVCAIIVGIQVFQHRRVPLVRLMTILHACIHEFSHGHDPRGILWHFPVSQSQLFELRRLQVLANVEHIIVVVVHVDSEIPRSPRHSGRKGHGIEEVLRRKLELSPSMQLLTDNLLHELKVLLLVLVPTFKAILEDVPGLRSVDHGFHALRSWLRVTRGLSDLHDDP
mmetsp:Transcript_37554/g.86706  ORF Transcript_37554/g.86706 Transcript_37554/m.86706 type:complete len:407 (-) Transcript_37554:1006-2226(-)